MISGPVTEVMRIGQARLTAGLDRFASIGLHQQLPRRVGRRNRPAAAAGGPARPVGAYAGPAGSARDR